METVLAQAVGSKKRPLWTEVSGGAPAHHNALGQQERNRALGAGQWEPALEDQGIQPLCRSFSRGANLNLPPPSAASKRRRASSPARQGPPGLPFLSGKKRSFIAEEETDAGLVLGAEPIGSPDAVPGNNKVPRHHEDVVFSRDTREGWTSAGSPTDWSSCDADYRNINSILRSLHFSRNGARSGTRVLRAPARLAGCAGCGGDCRYSASSTFPQSSRGHNASALLNSHSQAIENHNEFGDGEEVVDVEEEETGEEQLEQSHTGTSTMPFSHILRDLTSTRRHEYEYRLRLEREEIALREREQLLPRLENHHHHHPDHEPCILKLRGDREEEGEETLRMGPADCDGDGGEDNDDSMALL